MALSMVLLCHVYDQRHFPDAESQRLTHRYVGSSIDELLLAASSTMHAQEFK